LEVFGLNYEDVLRDTAMLSAVRTNIGQAVAFEAGDDVSASDVETVLSAGPSSGSDSVLAEIYVTPPKGVRPETIRDTLVDSAMLGDRVSSGIDSVNEIFEKGASAARKVEVKPYAVPVVKDKGEGLAFLVPIAAAAAGALSLLAGIALCHHSGGHEALAKARSKILGPTEEEERAARRGMLCGCGTNRDYKMVKNSDETGGWLRRNRGR